MTLRRDEQDRPVQTWSQFWVRTWFGSARNAWFALAVLTLVVVISARFLLVTGFPRTATADPKAAPATGSAAKAPTAPTGPTAPTAPTGESKRSK